MKFDSVDAAHEALSKGFFLESAANGDPIPKLSNFHREGVIAAIYSDRALAEVSKEELSKCYNQEINVRRISGLWDTLIELARCGVVGIMLNEKHPVFFKNRLSDMDRSLPTVACIQLREDKTETFNSAIEAHFHFGVRGKIRVNEQELLPWKNFRAIDAMSIRWMLKDSPLPESVEPYTFLGSEKSPLVAQNGATLLGPYVYDMGAVPIFSGKCWAEYYGLTNGLLEYHDDELVPTSDIECCPIEGDFLDFLDWIHNYGDPFMDIGLNPTSHRFRQGIRASGSSGGCSVCTYGT